MRLDRIRLGDVVVCEINGRRFRADVGAKDSGRLRIVPTSTGKCSQTGDQALASLVWHEQGRRDAAKLTIASGAPRLGDDGEGVFARARHVGAIRLVAPRSRSSQR